MSEAGDRVAIAPPAKWWGWGDPAERMPLREEAVAMLRAELGEAEPSGRVELEEVAIAAPRELPARGDRGRQRRRAC